jgi:hypothetical protein
MTPLSVTSFQDLRDAFKQRAAELGMRHLDVDDAAGWAPGYFGKLQCGMKNLGETSLPRVLMALGLELVIRPAGASTSWHVENPLEPQAEQAGSVNKVWLQARIRGGKKRMLMMLESERTKHQKKAARARWRLHNLRKAEKRLAKRDGSPVEGDSGVDGSAGGSIA